VSLTSISAIEAMVAPVVLITSAALLTGALLAMHNSIHDRVRAMDHERLEILTGAAGAVLPVADVPAMGRERLTQIDTQLPGLLHRHRLLHHAVLLIFASIAVLVLSVIVIAAAVTGNSGEVGITALVLVLAGTVTLLGGLFFAARSIMVSAGAINYEAERTLALGTDQST
jgi:hypothetical protein